MNQENKQTYKEQRKKAREFKSREEYLEHELTIMKFRRWRIHLPFRDFNIELEDLVPALAATIGKVVMVTAMVAAFAAQFGLAPEFIAENVRYELLIAGGIFCDSFFSNFKSECQSSRNTWSYDSFDTDNCCSWRTPFGVGDFNWCIWYCIEYYQRRI